MDDAKLSAGGAIAAAFGAAASWLCCLPFALGAFGTLGSGLANFLGPLRPYITVLSVGLLGFAFYRTYRKQASEDCALEGDCDSPSGRARKARFLWFAAALTLAFVTVPYWLNWVIYWTL